MGKKKVEYADWRQRPRKDPEYKKASRLSIRVTDSELKTLHTLADKGGMTLADFVVCKALGIKQRT
jgi:uncharacterized protein (DUF1778 family)